MYVMTTATLQANLPRIVVGLTFRTENGKPAEVLEVGAGVNGYARIRVTVSARRGATRTRLESKQNVVALLLAADRRAARQASRRGA